jgi:hypothetical protein
MKILNILLWVYLVGILLAIDYFIITLNIEVFNCGFDGEGVFILIFTSFAFLVHVYLIADILSFNEGKIKRSDIIPDKTMKTFSENLAKSGELLDEYKSNSIMDNKKVKEFNINMTCYNLDNKYTLDEINDMFIDWANSKDICIGGVISPNEE